MNKLFKLSSFCFLWACFTFSSCDKDSKDEIDDLIGNYTYVSAVHNTYDILKTYENLAKTINLANDGSKFVISISKKSQLEFSMAFENSLFNLSASSVKYSEADNSLVVSKADVEKITASLSDAYKKLFTIKSITGKFNYVTDQIALTITFSPTVSASAIGIKEGSITITIKKR